MAERHPTAAGRAATGRHPEPTSTNPGTGRQQRIGRPRASGIEGSGNPREDLLTAAAELFGAVGYVGATTRAIAARAGIRQSSMFYYFRSKTDLLAALFERIITTAVQLVDQLDDSDLEPAAKLYALAYGDVWNMTSSESNIALLQFINEAQGEHFDQFWKDYATLREAHARYLTAGLDDGTMSTVGTQLATDVILGVIDSVAMWFGQAEHPPEQVARELADTVTLYVLADKTRLASVRSSAIEFLASQQPLGDLQP